MRNRQDCLKPFIESPSIAANNNTWLASGVLGRKKLDRIVQKRIARIIAITYGLSRTKTLYTRVRSQRAQADDALPAQSYGSTLRGGSHLARSSLLHFASALLNSFGSMRTLTICRLFPGGRFLILFALVSTHLYICKEINIHVLGLISQS